MSKQLSTSEGMAILKEMGPKISHVEFRILCLLTGYPEDQEFRGPMGVIQSDGRLTQRDTSEAIFSLRLKGVNFFVDDKELVWRVYH